MEQVNTKNTVNIINERIGETVEIIIDKLQKINDVDEKKTEEMKEKLKILIEDLKEQKMDAFEMIDGFMKLQNELIEFLDTDEYKQKSMKVQQHLQYPSEGNLSHDTAMQIYVPQRKKEIRGIIAIIKEKIAQIFKKKKPVIEISSIEENTPTINQIASIISKNRGETIQRGFIEDYRKPVYDFIKNIKNGNNGIVNEEKIYLSDEKEENYFVNSKMGVVDIYLDGKSIVTPMRDYDNTGKYITIKNLTNLLAFSELINRKGENELKIVVLKTLKKFHKPSNEKYIDADYKKFKETLYDNDVFFKYMRIYEEAINEFELTSNDFYRTRDEAKRNYRRDIKNKLQQQW